MTLSMNRVQNQAWISLSLSGYLELVIIYFCQWQFWPNHHKKMIYPMNKWTNEGMIHSPSLLALNGGGRFLSPSSPLSSLLCSLVSWETLSALLSKLKYYGLTGLLMQLTLWKLGFRGTWLPWRNVAAGYTMARGRGGESCVLQLFPWRTLISTYSEPW